MDKLCFVGIAAAVVINCNLAVEKLLYFCKCLKAVVSIFAVFKYFNYGIFCGDAEFFLELQQMLILKGNARYTVYKYLFTFE